MITTPISLLSAYGTPFELAHALRTSKVTHMFVEPSLLPKALKAAKEVGVPESNIYILEGHSEGRKSFQDLIDDVKRAIKIPVIASSGAGKPEHFAEVFRATSTDAALGAGMVSFRIQHGFSLRNC